MQYDAQTASLDQANGRTSDVIQLADTCQARQRDVLESLKPSHPAWQFWKR